jgi:hypothetical protein
MLPNVPAYIAVAFGLTTLLTLAFFYWAIRNATAEPTRRLANRVGIGLISWLLVQAAITFTGIYTVPTAPPKIVLFGILPTVGVIIFLLLTPAGRRFMDSLPLQYLTWLHVVRILVEVVLLGLFLHRAVPDLMTFEGRNVDILSGLTAPVVAWFGFQRGQPRRGLLLLWNGLCLALLANVVVIAFLSAPTPLQQFAFEQPNIAIGYVPFSWLPTFVVPMVLFSHLAALRRLWWRA